MRLGDQTDRSDQTDQTNLEKRLESRLGGLGFGGLFGGAGAAAEFVACKEDGGAVGALVVGSFGGEIFVDGNFAGVVFLGPLLEPTFGVLAARAQFEGIDLIAKDVGDGLAGGRETTIEINRSDEGLKGIFEHGLARIGVVLAVGFAHFEVFSELLVVCRAGYVFAVDDAGAGAVEGTFVGVGEFCVEFLGDNEVEHGVAEKLQALVVASGAIAAGVREGLFEQGGIFKAVPRNRVD